MTTLNHHGHVTSINRGRMMPFCEQVSLGPHVRDRSMSLAKQICEEFWCHPWLWKSLKFVMIPIADHGLSFPSSSSLLSHKISHLDIQL